MSEAEELTFDKAIDQFRHTFIHGGYGSQEYQDALNYISFHWDFDRAREINHAVAPIGYRKKLDSEPDYVYILMSVRSGTYCKLHRNQWAEWI
jgi:hypothetical protein